MGIAYDIAKSTWCITNTAGNGIRSITINSRRYQKRDYQDHFMGNVTMTSVYTNISEDTYDVNKYYRLLITVIIAASTIIINT